MAVGDEPDFGFLNDNAEPTDSQETFHFEEPKSSPDLQDAAQVPPPTVPEQDKTVKSKLTAKPSSAPDSKPRKSKRPAKKLAAATSETQPRDSPPSDGRFADSDSVPKTQFLALAAFAGLVSLLLALQLFGIIRLGGQHQLESVPDVAPLKEGEFQAIPETASLPVGHELKLGQQARFGDIVFTATKVVREPVSFVHMTTGKAADDLKSASVLKLYFTVKNVSEQFAFAPWDVALMNHRSPAEGLDASTKANSWLLVTAGEESQRILNFFHSPNSNFNISGMNSRVALQPDESRSTFIASSQDSEDWTKESALLRWRIQIRKGVNQQSKQSVTTFVDVTFDGTQIQS